MRFFPVHILQGTELFPGEVDLAAVTSVIRFSEINYNLLMEDGHWQAIHVSVVDSIEEHWRVTREGKQITYAGTARELPPKRTTKRGWEP